ncbi:MAG TPA: L-seryl-tRNA(Sec) selenium transferase [Terriglobia bacterium]|nr:L-seryl-tRNA(Sec) selenium transferase [Terriglobia bacterium]
MPEDAGRVTGEAGSESSRSSRSSQSDSEAGLSARLRQIPAVEEILGRPFVNDLERRAGRLLVREATREALEAWRKRITTGDEDALAAESLEPEIALRVQAQLAPSLRAVINATGVVLHTNLGRAPLAAAAVESLAQVAGRYSNLEYDLAQGERGKRDAHTDRLVAKLVGAEAALVVNNNAAAVFLALNSLAEGGEVVISRGELIEIGGSFRIPDICAKSGATIREVGTTNRTRLADYASVVSERTRVLLRVHPSNFRMVGFTERPELRELAQLAHLHNLLLIEDLGSGCLLDLTAHGLRDEPPVGQSLKGGADVVTFSGDKLLGGPQAGILVGNRETLQRIRKNPLFRALRVDKLTIAALEATARLYLRQDLDAIPALRMIRAPADSIAMRAQRLASRLATLAGLTVELESGESVAGGGSTPGQSLPTTLVSVEHLRCSAQEVACRLRHNRPPVIARVERDRLLLDLRTVLDDDEEEQIVRAFGQLTVERR